MDGISVMTNPGVDMCGVVARCPTDSDQESVVSDYSEMADPVKEHLASIRLLQEAELHFGNVLGLPVSGIHTWRAIQRRPDEDEVEFLQRQRKINFLSLAQEFAAVKKVNPDALPFDLHKQQNSADNKGDESEESEEINLAQEFAAVGCVDETDGEVNQIEAHCSEHVHDSSVMDNATNNEHIVSQSFNVATNSHSSSIHEVVEKDCNLEVGVMISNVPDVVQGLDGNIHCDISKQPDMKFVEVDSDVGCYSWDALTRCSSDCKTADESAVTVMSHSKNVDLMRQQQRENIRLKLVVSDEDDNVFCSNNLMQPCGMTSCQSSCASLSMCYMNEAAFDDDDDDDDVLSSCMEELDAGPMGSPDLIAGMRRAVQRIGATCADVTQPLAELDHKELSLVTWDNVPETSVAELRVDRFDQMSLQRFNIAQLQVIVNEQLSRIEALNSDLVDCLVERDDLHRTQDSLLVDVEDLSRFLTKVTTVKQSSLESETSQH